jgi:hypothetical protein
MAKSKTYEIDTVCSNCDYTGKVFLPKKQKVSDVLSKIECPHCGCCTLSKKSNYHKDNRKTTPFLTNPNFSPFKPFEPYGRPRPHKPLVTEYPYSPQPFKPKIVKYLIQK